MAPPCVHSRYSAQPPYPDLPQCGHFTDSDSDDDTVATEPADIANPLGRDGYDGAMYCCIIL